MKTERRVTVIGHFGKGKRLLNGQTIKTEIITAELKRQLGNENVYEIDTYNAKKRLINLLISTRKALKYSKNIIVMPAHNGVRFFIPVLAILNRLYNKNIHYIVIGGWLGQYIENRACLKRFLKNFTGIHVETSTLKNELINQGLQNVYILPNCKPLYIIKNNNLKYTEKETLHLCTFSRVMYEKGIEDIVFAVKKVNSNANYVRFTLDIYGPIDTEYIHNFEQLKKSFPAYIQYKGAVSTGDISSKLKKYDILVFPTRFYTEGIPGTILDAYAAGLPVIASKWQSFGDLIEQDVEGYGYEFKNRDSLVDALKHAMLNQHDIFLMKENCRKKANEYDSRFVMKRFIKDFLR